MKTIEEVKNYVLNSEEYGFLKTEQKLKDNIILLVLGGSLSYGTYRSDPETHEILSDTDVRGIVLPPRESVLGLSQFEQFEHRQTDTVIYELRKITSLLLNCNPNTIEMLSPSQRNLIYCNKWGQKLIDNSQLFLSRRALYSFGGYAHAQLDRLRNSIARDALPQAEKEEFMKRSIERGLESFGTRFCPFENGSVSLYTDTAINPDFEREIFVDVNLKHYPLRDYKDMWSEMHNIVKTYGKLNHRNRKDELHLCKHAMHLVRLYLMGIDLLRNGEIITYREKDLDFLLSIRNGYYFKEDGTFDDKFFDIVKNLEAQLNQAAEESKLPKTPNYNAVEQIIMEILYNNI